MREALRTAFIIILAIFTATATYSAQADDKKTASQDPTPATHEEVEALRKVVAAQQREIEELKLVMERFLATDRVALGSTGEGPSHAAEPVLEPNRPTVAAAPSANSTQKEVAHPKGSGVRPQAGWDGQHFFIRSEDGSFLIQPAGYLQFDHRMYSGNGLPPATFLVRRGRFGFSGNLGEHYQFKIMGDFTDRNSTLAREFSLNINYHPALQFKVGQFKAPFSQEDSLVLDTYTDFVERSLVVNLSPGYTPGFQIHGQLLRSAVQYQVGAFNAKGYLNPNTTSTPMGILRLRLYPWQNRSNAWLKGLAIGGAVADGRTRNGSSITGVMPTGTFTFFPSQPVNGKDLRVNAEMTWIKGPFAYRAEYDQVNQGRAGLGPENGNLPGVVAKGYYATVTYLLTGEKRPENGQPVPHSDFFGKDRKGMGAWEIKFRYSNLQIEAGIVQSRADQFSTGVNWYLNSFTRYMLDFNVERLKNPVAHPVLLAPQTSLSILQRIQFRF